MFLLSHLLGNYNCILNQKLSRSDNLNISRSKYVEINIYVNIQLHKKSHDYLVSIQKTTRKEFMDSYSAFMGVFLESANAHSQRRSTNEFI